MYEKKLLPNDEIELTMGTLGSEGQGVGRYNGQVVFVPLALAGEMVSVRIEKNAGSYAMGRLMSIKNASKERRDPECRAYPECGGCDLLHMSYGAQLEFKRARVRDAMERIGGLKGADVQPVLGMDDPKRYRNKASFSFMVHDGKVTAGLYAKRSHRMIPIRDCLLQNEKTMKALELVTEWANKYGIVPYDERTRRGVLLHTVIRLVESGIMVVIVTTGALPYSDELVKMLTIGLPEVGSIIHNINKTGTSLIMGRESRIIYGGTLYEGLHGLRFEVSVESFLQVNPLQTEKLYMLAINGLGLDKNDEVIDLYCGIGMISLLMAKYVKSVLGIECIPHAISDARRNAVLNGIKNASFICAKAEDALPRLLAKGVRCSALLLDPPRKGAEPAALDAIIAGEIPKIAYISCDPSTLARDCKHLSEGGYVVTRIQPVDMFPGTKHVETVCHLTRIK